MVRFISILSVVTALTIVTACAATADPMNLKNQIRIIDNSKELAIFTDNTLVGKFGFKGVGNYTSTYVFSCDERIYHISVESVTDGKKFKSIISGIKTDTKPLRKQTLEYINEELTGVETIGPIGLQCSSGANIKNPVNLVINGGVVDAGTYHYNFVNRNFILTNDDFTINN